MRSDIDGAKNRVTFVRSVVDGAKNRIRFVRSVVDGALAFRTFTLVQTL